MAGEQSPISPMVYIHRSGAATLSELSALKGAFPADYAQLRQYAIDEMAATGVPCTAQ